MLQLNQIKALLDNHIPVKHFSKRSVVFNHYNEGVYRSHPNDETGEDWDKVDDEYFQASQYAVNELSCFGQVISLLTDNPHAATVCKVVKFTDRVKAPPTHHQKDVLVLVYLEHAESADEIATEQAIDHLLGLGWSDTEATALLVI